MNFRKAFLLIVMVIGGSINMSAQNYDNKKEPDAFLQIIQDHYIDEINNIYKNQSKNNTIIEGYKIQIYYGNRNAAYKKKQEFSESFEGINTSVIYEQPDFKTVIGEYHTKLDAERDLQKIKATEEFSNAFIIKHNIKR